MSHLVHLPSMEDEASCRRHLDHVQVHRASYRQPVQERTARESDAGRPSEIWRKILGLCTGIRNWHRQRVAEIVALVRVLLPLARPIHYVCVCVSVIVAMSFTRWNTPGLLVTIGVKLFKRNPRTPGFLRVLEQSSGRKTYVFPGDGFRRGLYGFISST